VNRTSIAQSAAIGASVRPCAKDPAAPIPSYDLGPTEPMSFVSRNIGLHVVSHRFQSRDGIRTKTLLEEDRPVHRAISDAEAGRIDGGLLSTRCTTRSEGVRGMQTRGQRLTTIHARPGRRYSQRSAHTCIWRTHSPAGPCHMRACSRRAARDPEAACIHPCSSTWRIIRQYRRALATRG
jgi:hypothetical protein